MNFWTRTAIEFNQNSCKDKDGNYFNKQDLINKLVN